MASDPEVEILYMIEKAAMAFACEKHGALSWQYRFLLKRFHEKWGYSGH